MNYMDGVSIPYDWQNRKLRQTTVLALRISSLHAANRVMVLLIKFGYSVSEKCCTEALMILKDTTNKWERHRVNK